MKPLINTLILMMASHALAVEPLADNELSNVIGGDGITVDFIAPDTLSVNEMAWVDDSNLLHVDNLRLQTKTASPLNFRWQLDAGSNGTSTYLRLNQNQSLTRQFLGFDGLRFGTGTGSAGGFGLEYQGNIDQSILLGGSSFQGSLSLNLSNLDLYHVQDGNQIALSNATLNLSIPAWTASITSGAGLQVSAPFTLDINNAALTHRSGGTNFTDGGNTFAGINARIKTSSFTLSMGGGGASGTSGLILGTTGTLHSDKSSYVSLIDDSNALHFKSISGTFSFPRIALDVVAPDILRASIGNYTAPNVLASANAAQANILIDDVNIATGATNQSLFGIGWNSGLLDARLDLKAGGSSGNGLRADYWWNSRNGEVRYLDEEGSQYFSFGSINTYGSSIGMTFDITGAGALRNSNGINLNMPNLVGDIIIDNVNVSGATTVWKASAHYNMGLDVTLKPIGGQGTQGLRLNADWQIKNTETDNTRVTFLDGSDSYSFENIGGTIAITDATLDVTSSNRIRMEFPNNTVSSTDASRIGSIKMGGVDMGSVQFRNFQTFFSAEMWGH